MTISPASRAVTSPQGKKVRQEELRVAYAKNQRLPQLDLKASYGLNGLGSTPGESWDDVLVISNV